MFLYGEGKPSMNIELEICMATIGLIAGILMVVVGTIMLLFGPIIYANVLNSTTSIFSDAGDATLNTTRDTITSNFYNTINLLSVAIMLIGAVVIIATLRSGLGGF